MTGALKVTAGGTFVVLEPARLQLACLQRGWSYRRLSSEARVSRPTVRAALLGRPIRPLTAYRIARALERGDKAETLGSLIRGGMDS